jgi:four helix bundle protein
MANAIPTGRAFSHIISQVSRSGTAVMANHAEDQSAQSRKDFIHKLRICMKEQRETTQWVRLIQELDLVPDHDLDAIERESVELERILYASIRTAEGNLNNYR